MSDIYLAISETPTVVTLTSAVINSAVASSVTVANVVTVALDANSLSALENVTVTVGAAITGTVTVGNSVTISSLPAISGTVTVGSLQTIVIDAINNVGSDEGFPDYRLGSAIYEGNSEVSPGRFIGVGYTDANGDGRLVTDSTPFPVRLLSTINVQAIGGTARIGVVTIGGGTVTIGAGTAQIGSVTASISGTVPISISSVTVGNSVTIGSLPAISGTVTANTFALQGTAVTTSNFTSTTASTVLASFDATREVLTIFNEGAGNLHVCAGATCTTIAYQVRLSAGDYYEVPNHQTTITHSAVFATAGTARVCQVS